MSSTYDFPGGLDSECRAIEGQNPERERFEKAWAERPWIVEDETDKDRAWRWWQAALASEEPRLNLPGHDETMAGLNSLKVRE